MKLRKHIISFSNAFNGIKWEIETQPNFKVHFLFSLISLLAGFVLKISKEEFITIVILITLGLVIESINSAIEAATDAIDRKWRPDIRNAKDVSAGAMLLYAIGASSVALIIFIPKIILLFR